MTFKGCIVVQLTTTDFYVAVPPVAQPGVYSVLTKPLTRAEAFKVCKEMDSLHPDDWSQLTKDATSKPEDAPIMNRAAAEVRAKLRERDANP